MKKLNIVLLIVTLIGSWLFFQHGLGLNLLIFAIILLIITVWLNPLVINNKNTVLTIVGAVISSGNVVWHNSSLATTLSIISFVALAGLTINPQSSFFVASINSAYSFLSSILIKAIERLDDLFYGERKKTAAPKLSRLKIMSITFPIMVAIGFLMLYASANPKLNRLFADINLDFINWSWIRFTFFSYLVLFGFFYQTQVHQLTTADARASNELKRTKQKRLNINFLALKYELKSGWLLFLLLNLVLFGFHLIDAFFLLVLDGNNGVGHSEYLHQGVNTLIFSIILAIIVILYFFRGNLNFYKKNRKLKLLVYAWVAQNALLLITTALKNFQYIADYGLTYKRIGVYFYLVLTLVGLITTYIKTRHIKSNWYLLRINSLAFYIIMLVATCFNGDKIITQYNLAKTSSIDIDYLLGLSDKNLVQLKSFFESNPEFISEDQKRIFKEKEKSFLHKRLKQQWFSWNYIDYNNEQKILQNEN